MKKTLFTLLILILGLHLSAMDSSAQMQSDNYRISTTVVSGGGGSMNSTSFQINGTLGQPTPIMEQGMDPFSDNYGLLPGFWYTIGTPGDTCPGDFNWDMDVDGEDLAEYLFGSGGLGLEVFATNFGKVNCP